MKAPEHLQPETAKWFETVVDEFELEAHHVKLLLLAAESWDQIQEAKAALEAAGGLIYEDRFGQPKTRPEVKIINDNRIAFARLLRELALDCEPPGASPRPPAIKNYQLRRV